MQEWIAKVWPSNFYRKGFISSCYFFVCCVGNITSCKKMEKLRKGYSQSKFCFVENRKFNPSFSYYKGKLTTFPNCFCMRKCFYIFGGKFANKSSLIFLLKKLPGETLCKLLQIFPPKVLVYIQVDFSRHLFN